MITRGAPPWSYCGCRCSHGSALQGLLDSCLRRSTDHFPIRLHSEGRPVAVRIHTFVTAPTPFEAPSGPLLCARVNGRWDGNRLCSISRLFAFSVHMATRSCSVSSSLAHICLFHSLPSGALAEAPPRPRSRVTDHHAAPALAISPGAMLRLHRPQMHV